MGPMFPTITFTDSDGVTSPIIINEMASPDHPAAHGRLGFAMTSKGRKVIVWKANSDNSFRYKYFCHGHSLGTYRRFGYSVGSGVDVLFALEDDCYEIGADQIPVETIQLLKVGDIVSFAELSGKILHTAKVFCININPNDPLRRVIFDEIILSTKNGYRADCLQPILDTLATYPTIKMVRFWRARTCFGDTMQQ